MGACVVPGAGWAKTGTFKEVVAKRPQRRETKSMSVNWVGKYDAEFD